MVIDKASATSYCGDITNVKFETNCAHVRIMDKHNKVLFERGFDSGVNLGEDWLDEKHTAINKALSALETAILNAVGLEY
jgi:hypothetical protein